MLTLYGQSFSSRLLLGTAQYPSPESLKQAVKASGAEIVTVSLRRESARALTGQGFWALIEELGCRVLPNTAGCRTAKEAIATAQMARELFGTDWIKLEVIANDDTLQPDLFGLVEAATALSADGFAVLPYTTEDLERRRAARRRGLRRADAVGRADRFGARVDQQGRAEDAARLFPRHPPRHRRRNRHALACGRGNGTGLRRRSCSTPPWPRRAIR